MRVLYVSHTGVLGGGEISMLELIRRLPGDVEPVAAVPEGRLLESLRELGVTVVETPAVAASLRMSPVSAAAAAGELRRATRAVARVVLATAPAVIHANSARAALVARGAPTVTFIRDVLPPTRVSRTVQRSVARRSAAIVANSRYTAAAFAAATQREPVVVYPPIDTARFAPTDTAAARARLGIDATGPVLGVVAQLTPWKGQADAITALAHVRKKHPGAQLVLAGEAKFTDRRTRFDNVAYESALRAAAAGQEVAGAVHLVGERADVETVFAAVDVLLAPSWEEPFGRSVAEGMAAGVPVIATDRGGHAEQIDDGHDGILVPPADPALLSRAIVSLLSDDGRKASIGAAARETARGRHDIGEHVRRVVELYAAAASRPAERAA